MTTITIISKWACYSATYFLSINHNIIFRPNLLTDADLKSESTMGLCWVWGTDRYLATAVVCLELSLLAAQWKQKFPQYGPYAARWWRHNCAVCVYSISDQSFSTQSLWRNWIVRYISYWETTVSSPGRNAVQISIEL